MSENNRQEIYDELRYFFHEHYESDQLGQFTCDVLNAIMRLHGDCG